MQKENWQCRVSPTLGGGFAGTPNQAWGTKDYENDVEPTVFFGLYGLPDFYSLWRHKGRKCILWAGGDILHFRKGYWLEDGGGINLGFMGEVRKYGNPHPIVRWLNKYCEHYVENEAEVWQLKDCGLKNIKIVPSFLGNIKDYGVSFKQGNKVYLSGHNGRQTEYGWGVVQQIACAVPEIEFHLYGADSLNAQKIPNIINHGVVSQKQMDSEVNNMQCGLRLNKHDGFSEITAKSILWGQYPITYLYFPEIDQYTADGCGQVDCISGLNRLIVMLKEIPKKKKPNLKGRNYYLKIINKYPWNKNK